MKRSFKHSFANGFTMIEIVIVSAIFLVLITLTYINFIKPQRSFNFRNITSILRADIRHQQLQTMSGQYSSANNSRAHGIKFDTYSYTLFTDNTYDIADTTNFVVELPSQYEFSTINLPSSQIVFSSADASISGYNPSQNSLVLRNIDSNEQMTITVNNYGTMTVTP